jgi:hypothetical protein
MDKLLMICLVGRVEYSDLKLMTIDIASDAPGAPFSLGTLLLCRKVAQWNAAIINNQ